MDTIVSVTWTIYLALILGFFAVAGAVSFLAVRTLHAWRSLKRLRRNMNTEFERLAALTEAAAEKAAQASDQTKLAQVLAQLRLDLARLAVLRAAVDEATDAFGRLTAVVPRK